MEELQSELESIQVSAPSIILEPKVDETYEQYPKSYKENTTKEKYLLTCCENFQRQYSHLYRDRKPLFLSPKNECNIEKFVCTSIRPTLLKYEGVYDYDGCMEFVADYLNFQPLDPPIELPSKLNSPTTVLKNQTGNSFDYCNLLCSLMIGAGYDAYCVSGYATREVTLMDETREECPLLKKKEQNIAKDSKTVENKYAVKPPKDLKSKFEAKMEEKKRKEEEDKENKRKEEELQKVVELEKPPSDKLFGLRVHCWVLVLAGKREVPESFFIESLTGQSKALGYQGYLGIENIWNHRNVWINMQDCSQGVKNISYDLGDALRWEFMFPNTDKPLVVIPDVNEELLEIDNEEEALEESTVEYPPSWVNKIEISPQDFQTRCPLGKKTKFYKRAKLEKYCEYLNKDGLITRIAIASDNELKHMVEVQEFYKNRADKLERKIHNLQTGWITEYFVPGRVQSLKEHSYKAADPGPESERIMLFYSRARVDGLCRREEKSGGMTEVFEGREDYLSYRYAKFVERVKKFGPQGANNRPIGRMVERFERNVEKLADKDIAERSFMLSDDRILLKFHLEKQRITCSTREFMKPPDFTFDKTSQITLTPEMTSSFKVDENSKPDKDLDVYNLLIESLNAEKKCMDKIRESEEEVREILNERLTEEANSELLVSVYDTDRNEKALLRRQELEKQQKEEEMRKRDMALDYLAPFLARIATADKLTRNDALKVKEECLNDLKQRLIDKANLIQARFEKETSELQKKQSWYQENQMNMTKEDEEEYLNFCSEAMFRIHILELRLNRHKEMAPHKYMQLDEKLRKDSRLSDYIY